MKTVTLKSWIEYLLSRVGIDLYVWGGNGQTLVLLLPKIYDMEKVKSDVARVLKLLQKRLLKNIDIYTIRCEDCSGLAIKFLLDNKILKSDTTANGLWEYIVGTKDTPAHGREILIKDVRAGDYLFMGSDTNKWHVGYAVSETRAVESKNHDEGVVETIITDRGWKYAARPDWYEDEKENPVLTRELYLTDPMMQGEDVRNCQTLLIEKGYNPGKTDGVYGKNTEIAVKNFQTDAQLDIKRLGTVGKKTAEALGFIWEG